MSENKTDAQKERQKAIEDWEKQSVGTSRESIVADVLKKNAGGMAIFAVALLAMGGVYWWKHGGDAGSENAVNGARASDDLTIAERKLVPKLKQTETPATAPPEASAPSAQQANDPVRVQREQMEMQRKERERQLLEARLKSGIVAQNMSTAAMASEQPASSEVRSPTTAEMPPGLERGPQDANSRFARAVSNVDIPVSKVSQIENLEYKVLQGKLIDAVLEPRADSDLPGSLRAIVQRDVYGEQGRNKLLPWGTRLIGIYSAEVRKGQDRLFVVWNRAIRPDGMQVTLDSYGADQLGTAGMGGEVNNHFAQIFGVSALLSIIGAGAANTGVNPEDQNNSAAAYRSQVQQAAANTSQQVLAPYINIPPTVIVKPGSRIRVFVNRDLDFTSAYQAEIESSKSTGVVFLP